MNTAAKQAFYQRFIGDKHFYKMVLTIAVPMMIQNGITNFVGLLDNIMIGQIGTAPMSGASIVNQLLFVYNLCIFGAVSGAGIFTAQYFGQGDTEGVKNTFRFKLWIGILLTALTIILFLLLGDSLIHMYLTGEGTVTDAERTLQYGKEYMLIMLFGLPALMFGQVYSSTLRECGETVLPMKAGLISVVLNLCLNYLLIYGKCGLPALGVQGAALATIIARFVECFIIVFGAHKNHQQYAFINGLYNTLKVPADLTFQIVKKGLPLLLNETLWAAGIAMLAQCYSVRSLNVVAGLNISNTINNVFNIVFIALGDSVAIIVGQILGSGDMKKARDTDTKMIVFSVACCTIVAMIMFFLAPVFPLLFKTNPESQELGKYFIMITAFFMPQSAFLHACYFTLRSGGKTIITFIFDSVFIWAISVTLAFTLSYFTTLPVLVIYTLVQLADFLKCILGFILVKKGVWLQNFVS